MMKNEIEEPEPPHDSRAAGGRLHLLVGLLGSFPTCCTDMSGDVWEEEAECIEELLKGTELIAERAYQEPTDEIIRTHQMACAARLECEELREALRKAVAWGESASRHILYRENINWRYLDEARAVLDKANAPHQATASE